MKLVLVLLSLLCSFSLYSQKLNQPDSTTFWSNTGNFSLLISQTAFNNDWLGGGTSNYAGNIIINYDLNYKKDKIEWDTKFLVDYGITKNDSQEFNRKTNDRFEVNSIIGKRLEATKWYLTGNFNFRSQLADGYTFSTDENGNETRTLQTELLSPAFTNFGIGFQWKKNDNLKVNVAPLSGRLILANDKFTSKSGYKDGDFFGLNKGETIREEFGASLNGVAKFDLMENISVENLLNLYTNYLEDPQNVDIDYTFNLLLKVNEYISTNFTFQAIYDDNAVKGFQVREVLGAGLRYKFL